jgi:hypothetical protein
MALSGTSRGTGGNATAATTINISPTSNCTAGSAIILAIAYDNAGSAGSDNFSSISFPNSVWSATLASPQLNDPGAANAGSVLRIYGTNNLVQLNTTDTITITFAANVTAKAWTLTEITTDVSNASINLGFTTISTNQGNGTTQTLTQSTVLNGYMVFGVLGQEGNGTRTGDSDTVNGNWSTAQTTGFGTTTSGQEIITQFKIVNADGNQTWNPTATPVGDWNMQTWRIIETIPDESFDPFGRMGFFGI